MRWNFPWSLPVLVAALMMPVLAVNLDLRGQVTVPTGERLPGVRVELVVLGFSTITDDQGAWAFSGDPTGLDHRTLVKPTGGAPGGRARIELATRRSVRLDGFDARGVRSTSPEVGSIPERVGAARQGAVSEDDTVILLWKGKVHVRIPVISLREGSLGTNWIDTAERAWNNSIQFDSFIDPRDGRCYRVVKIGSVTWMAENIDYHTPRSRWYLQASGNYADDEWQYGRMYDWADALGLPDSCNKSLCGSQVGARRQGVCPVGWHVSTDAEWDSLVASAGGAGSAGARLKSIDGWSRNGDGTSGAGRDELGFRGLPGGYGLGPTAPLVGTYVGMWWTANEQYAANSIERSLNYDDSAATRSSNAKTTFESIRCVQDR